MTKIIEYYKNDRIILSSEFTEYLLKKSKVSENKK